MVHADKIHKWLTQPGTLADTEQSVIAGMLEKYPYCIPVRYLQAALAQKENPFAPESLGRMQLFTGNWLLYYQMLQRVSGQEQEPLATPSPSQADRENRPSPPDPVRREKTDVAAGAAPEDTLIQPVSAADYFLSEGVRVPDALPPEPAAAENDRDKSLLVVMSFSEWLLHFKTKSDKEREEEEGQKALRTMWQKEKLAAALEDEADEIPEAVFNMAVNSITREEDLASEPLAAILIRQGKYDKAIGMYRKLSLRNPQKSAYFARQIEKIQKEKEL